MELNPIQFDSTLAAFLASWNPKRIRTMEIDEYADLSDHDSLCYWLEYGTKNLGAIGAIALNKFELWVPRKDEGKNFKDTRFRTDGKYAWNARMGLTAGEAFAQVKQQLSDVVDFASRGDWNGLDEVPFHAIGKWKLAFLFSSKRLLPVYSMRALLPIARGLGHVFKETERISAIQRAILQHKPDGERMEDFAYRIYNAFASKDKASQRNYYMVDGGIWNKEGNGYGPLLDKFLEHGCTAFGWLSGLDFGSYMGALHKQINAFVDSSYTGYSPTPSKIKGYFRRLAAIKAGDIVAVKCTDEMGLTGIVAYAEVIEKAGSIYFHDEHVLGHQINVAFLDTGFFRPLDGRYSGTLSKLSPEKQGMDFYRIFGWYVDNPGDFDPAEEGQTDDGQEGYNEKDEDSFERSAVAAVTVDRIHNQIQNRFIRYLKASYPNDRCSGEKRFIDAKRVSGDSIYIYEIKPYSSVYRCIREGIGQLLDYMHKEQGNKQKRLFIVGPDEPGERDLRFLKEVRELLNVPFGYLAFDVANKTAKEY